MLEQIKPHLLPVQRGLIALPAFALALVSLISFYRAIPIPTFAIIDDAYMFVRYAQHFIDGHGFSWNINSGRAFGCTSTLWLLLVTLGKAWTELPNHELLGLLSFLAVLAWGLILPAVLAVFVSHPLLKATAFPLVFTALLFTDQLRYHARTGMETGLAILINTLLIAAVVHYLRRPAPRSFFLLMGNVAAALWIRPENIIYAVLFPTLFLAQGGRTLVYRYWLGLAGVLALTLLINQQLFGSILPLSFFAKQSGFHAGLIADVWDPVFSLQGFLFLCLPFLAVICFCSTRAVRLPIGALLLPVFVTAGYLHTVVQIMGCWSRFYLPGIPFVAAAAVIALNGGLAECASARPPRLMQPRRLVAMALLVAALLFEWPDWLRGAEWRAATAAKRCAPLMLTEKFQIPALSYWLAMHTMARAVRQLPAETTLAMSEYGLVGALSPEKEIIDLVGLHDPYISWNGFSADYVMGRAPELIWMPYREYTCMLYSLESHPRFQAEYDYFPMAFASGIAVWRLGPRYELIVATLKQAAVEQFQTFGQAEEDWTAFPCLASGVCLVGDEGFAILPPSSYPTTAEK